MARQKGSKLVKCVCGSRVVMMPGEKKKCAECGKTIKA